MLNKMENNNFNVFKRQEKISKFKKIWITACVYLKYKFYYPLFFNENKEIFLKPEMTQKVVNMPDSGVWTSMSVQVDIFRRVRIDLLASFTNVDMCSRSNVEIYNRKTFKKKSFSELNQREPH